MNGILIVFVIVSSLAGCTTVARQTDEGYALPREGQPFPDRAVREATTDSERARAWSVRDFAQPRGLLR